MNKHPIQGGVEILLVASCYGNRDKHRPNGLLDSKTSLVHMINLKANLGFTNVYQALKTSAAFGLLSVYCFC